MATMIANGRQAFTLTHSLTGCQYRVMSNGVVLRRVGSGRFKKTNNFASKRSKFHGLNLHEIAEYFERGKGYAVERHIRDLTIYPRPKRRRTWN